ncbi:MAG: hypothetical protein REI95_01815 [Oxalicibacterium faecigallinarum]|uniref:hypothetical protein n=1 Tax=Oxalicibacterium faecigallinarum TaxID=573741 RepID=UPI0028088B72|nr:hypothetical protein [Oxalicibacterium faecigallinarum]MDQ7968356.1 hypothetical protein [Oxalicibacterium faecigallinarum]
MDGRHLFLTRAESEERGRATVMQSQVRHYHADLSARFATTVASSQAASSFPMPCRFARNGGGLRSDLA